MTSFEMFLFLCSSAVHMSKGNPSVTVYILGCDGGNFVAVYESEYRRLPSAKYNVIYKLRNGDWEK
jgi:hypothetical protein